MKRLIIYFCYDPQGRLDTAVRIAVQAMAKYGEVLFVFNGTLQPADRAWVRGVGARLLERENIGLDVGAYRAALLAAGRERLAAYDEVLLMNFTLAGPVRADALEIMFAAMDARTDLGFWGLTRHYAMKSRRFGGSVPEHLQSHFIAVRKSLLAADAFWTYWEQMPLPKTYEESVTCHETAFTAHFAAQGFAWDSYVNTDDLRGIFVNPIMACPAELLRNRGCPFFKRRSLFTDYADELRRTDGLAARTLYDYIKRECDYPVSLLTASLLRTQPLAALSQNLHWHVILKPEAGTQAADLEALGLCLVRCPPPDADAVTSWYWRQTARQADALLPQAAALFEDDPMLGIVSPAQPLWQGALLAQARQWQTDRAAMESLVNVPLSDDAPPVPNAGWALVRAAAVPNAERIGGTTRGAWLLGLTAQQNGFTCKTFESDAQAAARADILGAVVSAANSPSAVAKQLGRLAKHGLTKK